jgi:hypothetical protein
MLFGGKVRDTLPLHRLHCGTYRFHHAAVMGQEPIHSPDNVVKLGVHVKTQGSRALKTNVFRFGLDLPNMYQPCFARSPGGAGYGLFCSIRISTSGRKAKSRSRALVSLKTCSGFEIDSYDSEALRLIWGFAPMPIVSCEALFSRRQFRAFFESRAIDMPIVDVPWNTLAESHRISTMVDAYEMNCAPHNFYGHLSTLMRAHFCLSIPIFRIMEIDNDDVSWEHGLVTPPHVIKDGALILPDRPGWGADINEEAVCAQPPRHPHP